MVVNVEQLTSDEELRDRRLRHDYLQSDEYPLATLRTTGVEGLPDEVVDGRAEEVELSGELTVKDVTVPVTVPATVTLEGDELRIDAATLERIRATGKGWQSRINAVLAREFGK